MNVVLTGYRCTGKTSVGRLLAEMGGRPFLDTDELVCRRAGKTIAEIVSARGWEAFREEERSVIAEVSRLDGVVIATGGGVVLDPENIRNLKRNGRIVWLFTSAETIVERMAKDAASRENRPPLSGGAPGDEVHETLAQREEMYRQSADIVVDTDALGEREAAGAISRAMAEIFRI